MLPLIVRPALVELLRRRRRPARPSTTGSASCFYVPGGRGRHLRPARRLPHRPARPAARARRGASCSTRSRRSRPAIRRRSTGCSSGAAARSSASASSSSRRSRGWRSCSPIRSSASAVVGYTQAFGSIGGLMVTGAYYLLVTYGHALPAVRGGHEAWRYTLMSGVIPAIPLILIRPFLPESPAWREKKARRHAEASELRRALPAASSARTTIVTTIMMACGVRGGVRRDSADAAHRARACRKCAALARTGAGADGQRACSRFRSSAGSPDASCSRSSRSGIVSRRKLLHVFQIPGLILLPLVFVVFADQQPRRCCKWGIFLVGIATIAQFSFWGNYLPRVYPTLPARHRRELRGQRRRPDDRHVGGAGDHAAGDSMPGVGARRRSSRMRRRSSARSRT